MTIQHDDLNDLVGAYVLDALAPEEQRAFEEHLRTCERCRAEVGELSQVVDVLPLAIDPVEPTPGLRERILAEAAGETEERPRLKAIPGGAPARAGGGALQTWLQSREVWLAAAAAVVIIALGVWNLQLRNGKSQPTAYERAVVAALASGASVTSLHGTSAAPGASASLVQPRSGSAYLIVAGLPATPSDRVYELWFIHGATPQAAGTFTYGGSQAQIVQVPRSSRGYTVTAVTNERKPGGTVPHGGQVLFGKLRTGA